MPNFPADPRTVFNNVTLTAAHTGNQSDWFEFRSAGNVAFTIEYDEDASESANTCQIILEYSPDKTLVCQYGVWADGGSGAMDYTQYEYTVDDEEYPVLNVLDFPVGYYRLTAKETGVSSTFGKLTVTAYETPSSAASY